MMMRPTNNSDLTRDELRRQLAQLRQQVMALETQLEQHQSTEHNLRTNLMAEHQVVKSLKSDEIKLRHIVNSGPQLIVLLDTQGKILEFNEVANRIIEQIIGYPLQLEASILRYIKPEDRASFLQSFHKALRGQILFVERCITDLAGQEHWYEVRYSPVFNTQDAIIGITIVALPIGRRKEAEEALQQYTRRLQALREIDQAILAARSPAEIAQAAIVHIQQLIPCQRISIVVFDFETKNVSVLVDWPTQPLSDVLLVSLEPFKLKDGASSNYQPCLVNDISEMAEPPVLAEMWAEEGILSYISAPLIAKDELIGGLMLGADYPKAFKSEHKDIAVDVATSIAVGIRQAQLYEQTRHDADTKATLLREVNHRVKNNLAAIVGMLYVERRHAEETAIPTINDLINRIESLATVHQLLSASEWSPLSLNELVSKVVHSALHAMSKKHQIQVKIAPTPLRVIAKQASSLAIILNELTTNTVKYALNGRDKAHIDIKFDFRAGQVVVEFQDDGPGFPPPVLRLEQQSVGLYLVQNIVHRDLHGTVSLDNEYGAVVRIYFKLRTNLNEQLFKE